MAAPVRACCLCFSRSVQFVNRRDLTGQILSDRYIRSADKLELSRCIWIDQQHLNKNSDHSQVDQPTDVPVEKLKITYSRSSGPGGQHVNKVNTKAEVRFHVHTAEWIPEEVRNEILLKTQPACDARSRRKVPLKNKTRINKAGELIVTSEVSRSQQRNLEDCVQKISEIVSEASQKPPEPSEDDIALRAKRLEKRNLARLKEKKLNSATKRARDVGFD